MYGFHASGWLMFRMAVRNMNDNADFQDGL